MKVLTDKELLIQKKDILFIGEYEELPVEVKCLLKDDIDDNYYFKFNSEPIIKYYDRKDYIVDLNWLDSLTKEELKEELKTLNFNIKLLNSLNNNNVQLEKLKYKRDCLKEYLKENKRKEKMKKYA